VKSNELITWEGKGGKRKYFDYQNEEPTGRRETRMYEYVQWGDKEHHYNGKYLQTRGYDFQIPGVTKDSILEIYRDELSGQFTDTELEQLGDKDSEILSNLLHKWRDSWDLGIYSDPYYVFETVSCGINVTAMLQGDKLRNTSPVIHTLMWWDHLGYEPKTIIDVGAGVGLSSVWMASRYKNTQVYVDEISPLSVQLLRRTKKELGLENLHIGDQLDRYDAGTFYEVVEHIQSPDDPTIGTPFPWTDRYLERLENSFVYSTYWTKNESSVGHFDKYDFGKGVSDKPRTWGREMKKSMNERGWHLDQRPDFYGSLPKFFWRTDERPE